MTTDLRFGYVAGKTELREMGIDPVGATFGMADVFTIGGKPALAISWSEDALAGFAIHPDFQNKGLGKAFIRQLAQDRILEVYDPNDKMKNLLEG